MFYGIHDPDLALFMMGQADADEPEPSEPSVFAMLVMAALFVTGLCMLGFA